MLTQIPEMIFKKGNCAGTKKVNICSFTLLILGHGVLCESNYAQLAQRANECKREEKRIHIYGLL